MCDLIQFDDLLYAWGKSSLGDFIAARSDRGLVAFEFASPDGNAVEELQARFPDVAVTEHPAAMAETVTALAHLVDHPGQDPQILLDIRGTDHEKKVWELLRQIPPGTTTSYGAIAAQMGTRDARDVTAAIAANTLAILIPCHRVVKKDGSLSGYRWGAKRKRALIERERKEN
ncbi:MAG TPA: methylated-DNA--[protein]-cysteine S-methyltransferase [Reyranella sp.]|jgi:AraC family transcriptional regulator of adaptative response/methylated-DNA-[protein]-cysteine methyltransferase